MVEFLRFSCVLVRKARAEARNASTRAKIVRLKLIVEFIANAPNGENVLRGVGVWLNFFAQFSDKGHDIAVGSIVRLHPNGLIQLFFRKYRAGVLRQKEKNVEFFRRQLHFLPGENYAAAFLVDG